MYPYPRWTELTPKLAAILTLTALGVWLSVVTASPIGLFALPLTVLVALDLAGPPPVARLAFERAVNPGRVLVGEEVAVEVRVSNLGGPIARLELEDELPEHCVLAKGSTTLVCTLKPGECATLRYTVSCNRVGVYGFGDLSYRVSTLLGLFERRERVSVTGELRVYPPLIHRRLDVGWVRTLSWVGLSQSRRMDGRAEYLEIRQYSAGDPLDSVNWKAYARTSKPQVNVWSSERGLDCVIVVDMYSGDVSSIGDWSAQNQIVCCAYELASSLIRGGNRVGLVVLGSILLKIPPAYGGRQLRRIVEALVDVSEGSAWGAESVEWVLQLFFGEQYRERRGVLFFVAASPSVNLLGAIHGLSLKGFKTNLVYVDTLQEEYAELVKLRLEKNAKLDVGLRVAQAEREWFYKEASASSTVVEWTRDGGFRVVYP